MCGIVGVISWNKNQFFTPQQKVFKNLLYLDAFRGEDGTGVFGVNKSGNVDMIKTKDPSGIFVYSPEYIAFEKAMFNSYNIVVGHNRKATVGKIEDATAHPFISGNVVMVHNGKLQNHKKYYDTEVDSEALCKYLEAHEDNLPQAVSELDGAFSVVWYNAKTQKFRFWRNNERPMYHANVGPTIYFSSERSILVASLIRASVTFQDKDISELSSGIIHTLDMSKNNLKWGAEDVPEKPVKELPKSTYYGESYCRGNGVYDDEIENNIVMLPQREKAKAKTTENTAVSLSHLLDRKIVVPIVDYVQDEQKPHENYVEGNYNEFASVTVLGAPPSFFEQLKDWPHEKKFFRGKVSKVSSRNNGKTFEITVDPNIELMQGFSDADGNYTTYEFIESIGGADCVYCGEQGCYTAIEKKDFEHTRFKQKLDILGKTIDHDITCKDCIKDATEKEEACALVALH
jgi:predicted glutamine amidotransferase